MSFLSFPLIDFPIADIFRFHSGFYCLVVWAQSDSFLEMPCASRWECQGGWHSTLQHLATSCNILQHLATITICINEYRYVMVTHDTCHETITFTWHNLENALNSMRFLTMPLVRRSWRSWRYCQHLTSLVSTWFNMFQHVRRVVSFCLVLFGFLSPRPVSDLTGCVPGCPPLNCQQSKLHQAVERR